MMIHLARRMPVLPKRDRPLIFIVDDSEDMLRLYTLVLERFNVGIVSCFSNPLTALTAINEQRPNLVISDLAMPGMWGTELYERVFAHRANRPIRWVFMSPAPNHLSEAKRLQADAYIELPCDPRKLLDVVTAVLPPHYSETSPKDTT